MEFLGEHLLAGKIGHFFVLLAFVCSLLSCVSYFIASQKNNADEKLSWLQFARLYFHVQVFAVFAVFGSIFYICSNHYIEYLYAYKHTSKELEPKYLFASIWEDQGGSFLLWSVWHCILGVFLVRKSKEWETPVMTVVTAAQVFLAMMIMGVYFFSIKIGNSPFVLTRNEINGPIFSRPDYLSLIKDGVGLNVLLRNYWMVIHPPILFLGFASVIIPFAYAYAGLQTKKYGEWVQPALPYTLFSACVLGVGIMMGGKWAYESLSFGGYWAWDPVENASLVPWLILIAGLHTMLIYKATQHSLRTTYFFIITSFIFILYSTFLTRTGILGDTSVHAFTEAGIAMTILLKSFLWFFIITSFGLFFINYKKIPAIVKEEALNSREFWMFIGSLILFLSALFIIGVTSIPVYNKTPYISNLVSKFNGGALALPEDAEFVYNKVMALVAVVIGVLTAITQYFKYKATPAGIGKAILLPTIIALAVVIVIAIFYPLTYDKKGIGFLGALYAAFFATVYAVVANAVYIKSILALKFKAAGGSIAHLGFGLMIAGMIISAGNKKVISNEKYKAFVMPTSIDPMTKQQDNPIENMNLIRQVSTKMDKYDVTYLNDSAGHEEGRRFYHLLFQQKDATTKNIVNSFTLNPDVYMMKNNNMSSNPDIKSYVTHDIFTYISYALNPEKNADTASFKIHDVKEGDTIFYSKGYILFDSVIKNPASNKYNVQSQGPIVAANLTVVDKNGMHYKASPLLYIQNEDVIQIDDTVYAQNLFVKFAGVNPEENKIKIGIKESESIIDFVTIKAYIFPYINLVWIGLILMALGFMVSMLHRAKLSSNNSFIILIIGITLALAYMFLFAAN